jgi:SAM-dependent methyltransferase
MLNRLPHLKKILRKVRDRLLLKGGVSSNYVNLQQAEIETEGQRLRNSWQNESLPIKQRELVDQQLIKFRKGASIDVFDVFVKSLKDLPLLHSAKNLLEIGCSSGFYSEVLEIAHLELKYSGCDYSESFINLAKTKYPSLDFSIEDATSLSYLDASFDIVVSGCCLLHIPQYIKAIEQTARVAKSYAIFHRTPVVWGKEEQWYRKLAYGVETVEIHFNETQFLKLLEKSGLDLIATYTLQEDFLSPDRSIGYANRTYVCRKKD